VTTFLTLAGVAYPLATLSFAFGVLGLRRLCSSLCVIIGFDLSSLDEDSDDLSSLTSALMASVFLCTLRSMLLRRSVRTWTSLSIEVDAAVDLEEIERNVKKVPELG
jgi:hypothetical protein